MSRETMEWLNRFCLVGYTDQRGKAWHYRASEQGVEPNHYPGAIPVEDVLRRLFNFRLEESPVFTLRPDGSYYEVPNRKAIVANDDQSVLGIFSKDGYKAHQYDEWLLSNVSTLLDDTLQIGGAGLLRNRQVAYVQVTVPETIKTPEGVEFRPNLLAATSSDGTVATTYLRNVGVVVCDNTLHAGLSESGQKIKVRHSANSLIRIGDVREALAIVFETADEFTREVAELCNTTVTDAQWAAFLDEIAPLPEEEGKGKTMAQNKRNDLAQLWNHDERVHPWQNTAYGVVAAMNTYGAHLSIVRKVHRAERNLLNDITGRTEAQDVATVKALSKVLAAA